eukprot:TRINITY_DN124361_c0_g1_i1.p1 TRINITY_DN124361_c0_g1~~TRINITY_DN124361_c0_g1_i1.p1  ORF type:complete len:222 (+),score=22.48 TRINITY_DN124361_c0_g1_i1:58-666(+)
MGRRNTMAKYPPMVDRADAACGPAVPPSFYYSPAEGVTSRTSSQSLDQCDYGGSSAMGDISPTEDPQQQQKPAERKRLARRLRQRENRKQPGKKPDATSQDDNLGLPPGLLVEPVKISISWSADDQRSASMPQSYQPHTRYGDCVGNGSGWTQLPEWSLPQSDESWDSAVLASPHFSAPPGLQPRDQDGARPALVEGMRLSF